MSYVESLDYGVYEYLCVKQFEKRREVLGLGVMG